MEFSMQKLTQAALLLGAMIASASSTAAIDNDFNGDGIADIFWHDATDSSVNIAINDSNGAISRIEKLTNKSSDWSAQMGDFNGDGAIDILWRNSVTSAVKIATSDANGNQGTVNNLVSKGSAWQAHIGDFNADGRDDILWRKPSAGSVAIGISDANGGQARLETFFDKGAAWSVFVGDFNADGGDDMLWRRGSDGSSKIVFTDANGQQASVVNALPFKRFSAWDVQVADFNGDGRDDIFWRKNDDGTVKVGITGTDGKQASSVTHFAKFNAWTADLADFNGDGRTDILWHRAATGTVKVAISNASGGQARVENLDAKFSAWTHHLADYNGDGRTDILWHKPSNGVVDVVISTLPFEILDQGDYSSLQTRLNLIANDATELNQIYQYLNTEAPEVDFKNNTAIGVFRGLQYSGGFSITIGDVVEHSARVDVTVELHEPGPECNVTSALTYPYHIVSIPKTGNKPITFIEKTVIDECQ
jgi:hypothetical protein